MDLTEIMKLPNLQKELFPSGYELLPGVTQIYELELALAESKILSCNELIEKSAYFKKINGHETNHSILCEGGPIRVGKNSSMKLRVFFKVYQFKTGYASHGLFPYKGKFHPQMIKSFINLIGIKRGDVILDPMTGSGTLNVEASIMGIDSIGVDISPFCVMMSKAKIDALTIDVDELCQVAKDPNLILQRFHKDFINLDSSGESKTTNDKLSKKLINVLKLCYFDAVGYSNRTKKTTIELFPKVLDRYVQVITNFDQANRKLKLKLGNAKIMEGDARNLKIEDENIDGIITSPPYSFAIDYLKGDKQQLEYLGVDAEDLRKRMIGLSGNSVKEKVDNYLEDMNDILEELNRVLKKKAYLVMIIGSNTAQIERELVGLGLNLEKCVEKLATEKFELVRRFIRPIEGMRNVMKNESVFFFRKC